MTGAGRTPRRGAHSPGALYSSALTRRGCVQYLLVAERAEEMVGRIPVFLLLSLAVTWGWNESPKSPAMPPLPRPDRKESRSILCPEPCSMSLWLLLLTSLGGVVPVLKQDTWWARDGKTGGTDGLLLLLLLIVRPSMALCFLCPCGPSSC